MGFSDDIAGEAKADPAYKKMTGDEADPEGEAAGDELGEAFDALKADDKEAFKEAMAAYVASCMK